MYELILNAPIQYPEGRTVSPEAEDIIMQFLDRNPNSRLGSRGIDEIKEHPFFEGVNFDDVYNKRLNPPFRPTLASS
jgi:hypothetical protein